MSKGQPASRPLAAHDPPLALDSAIDWPALEAESTQLLSSYLQFDTTNPPGNEAAAIEFLADLLRERGFAPQVIESAPGRANLIVRLPGSSQAASPACLAFFSSRAFSPLPTYCLPVGISHLLDQNFEF